MCGICGVRKYGEEPITRDMISQMLLDNEHRGNQATGVAIETTDGEIGVLKDDEPAWKFVTSRDYKEFMNKMLPKAMIVLGHTRAATKGDPNDMANNHPLFTGETAVVHNGMLNNDDELFRTTKYKRSGQVDSDILRAILDAEGLTKKGAEALKKVNGSCAIAAISTKFPGKLLIGRCGSPLVFAGTDGLFLWSSEKGTIHRAMRPTVMRFGMPMQPTRPDLAFMTVNNNSLYIMGEPEPDKDEYGNFENAIEWHTEFETSRFYHTPQYEVNAQYATKRERFYKGKLNAVWCDTCNVFISVPKKLQHKKASELHCPTCKKGFE